MATAMAPELSKIIVFEAGPSANPNDVLNRMASSNEVKQLSCSWGWGGGPSITTDNIFKQMAAQGQSFFSASGDSDAFTRCKLSQWSRQHSIGQCPVEFSLYHYGWRNHAEHYRPGGAWASESVNWGLHGGSYVGSSGGISSHYGIPARNPE